MERCDGKLKASGLKYRILADNGSTVEILTETGVRADVPKSDLTGSSVQTDKATPVASTATQPAKAKAWRPDAAPCVKHKRPYCHDCLGQSPNPIGNQTDDDDDLVWC